LVRSESAAQEILQETFLSAWQNMRSFAGRAQFEDWVFRAIAKAALGRMKFARGQGLTSIEKCIPSIRTNPRSLSRSLAREDADWVLRPSDQRGSEELYRHIRDTVDSLPDEQRAVFVLCDLEGMSAANSAEILELPVTTTAANLQTARLAVRDTIGRHFSKGDIN
jgi:RNA polymerase sigma-70 factor (ECF subfamily)